MRVIQFLLALLLTISFTCILNISVPLKTNTIPPLGKLLNPFSGFWQNAETIGQFNNESLDILDLKSPVKVVFDDKMVPHIFAENILDAFTVQGYLEAKNRLWQMDLSTRAASGRLSEIMGKRTLAVDKRKRRQGMLFAAENTLKTWKSNPKEFAYIEAYTKGVNSYVNALQPSDYPLEFKLLDYEPEVWTPLKSALFMKAMAETLCRREDDLESTNALSAFGRETFDFLFPEYNPKQSPIIPESVDWDFKTLPITKSSEDLSEIIGAIEHEPFEKPPRFVGSNNWAVAGTKTASGKPILCNDPHLNLTLPAIWYEIQIHTPKANIYGVSLPGFPGVMLGFNEHVAWGFTNVGQDVVDWYKIKWTDQEKISYYIDNEVVNAALKVETIKVKGQPDVLDTVRYTRWGPVAYESKDHPYQDLAMQWIIHNGEGNELHTLHNLLNSKSFDEFFQGLKKFDSPAQNVAFVTKNGDIALKVQGKFPLKEKEQGRFVRDGSKSNNDWQGFIPFEQTPFVKNPERGFISSANQHSTNPTYPYYYNSGSFEDYRGRILNRKLAEMSEITPKDMMALQNNNYSIKAEEALPMFLGFLEKNTFSKEEREFFDILQQWDYTYGRDTEAPVYFNHWYREFYIDTWDEIYALRKNDHPMLFPESWRTIEILETDPENIFFDKKDTPQKETAKEIAIGSFKKMVEEFKDRREKEGPITWQKFNNTTIPHLGRIPAFGFSGIPAAGHSDALNALRGSHGPSWRMIIEVGDEMKGYGVYPAGQSGNPGSPYYDSMIDYWANGKYYELLFLKNENEQNKRLLFSQEFH